MHLKSLSFVKLSHVLTVVSPIIIAYNIWELTSITLAKSNDNGINQNNNSMASNSHGTDVKQIALKWLMANIE
jgi:hypothetical protein